MGLLGGSMVLAKENLNTNKITSTVISVVAHVLVLVLIKTVHFSADKIVENPETYIDLGYQQFDEVPEVVSAPVPVVKNEPVIQEKSDPVHAPSQEMQDQSSDVAGLQKEVSKPVATTSTNTNTSTVPYYKIKPKYPRDALESNLEGHVLMKIDILEDGTVENIHVTGGEKIAVFESAATRAVAKWKYKAEVDQNGNPLRRKDYLVRVDFKIKDELQTQ